MVQLKKRLKMPLFVCKNSSGLFLVCSRWGVTVCRFFDEQILSFILLMIKIFYLVSCVEPLNHPLAIGCFFLLSLSVFIHSSSLSFNHSFLLHYLFLSIIHSLFIISLFHLFIITFFHPFIIPFFESFLHSSSSLSLSLSFFRSISVSTFLSLLLSQYYLLPFHQLPEIAATLHCEKQNHIIILNSISIIKYKYTKIYYI